MLNQVRFKQQMELLALHHMREFPRELLDEYWKEFKNKEQTIWDKAFDQLFKTEEWFPKIATLQYYYEMNLPGKPDLEYPSREDLEKRAREEKHKKYLFLIDGLREGEIKMDDPRILACLKEQGERPTFGGFNPERRIFEKI